MNKLDAFTRRPSSMQKGSELLHRFVFGNEDSARRAFDVIMKTYSPRIRKYLRGIGFDNDVEELVQLSMIKAWSGRSSFNASNDLHPWLFTIARNAAIDEKRKRRTRSRRLSKSIDVMILDQNDEDQTDLIDWSLQDPADFCETREQVDLVLSIAGSMRGELREALRMVYIEGGIYRETAEELGMRTNTLKGMLADGKKKIAKRLQEAA